MLHEQMTGQNWFAQFGGIWTIPEVRNGHIRSQAFFQHALIAGSFGATTFMLFIWLIVRARAWFFGALGAAGATVMTFTASTSTPILALIGGVGAVLLWPIRRKMRVIRWGIIVAIVLLQCVMKAPFWFALGHIDLSGGSTGWDRAMLIDNFLRHVGNWFFFGTRDNVNWGWDMWDACNQFVAEGFAGGMVCFTCFVAMFVLCFKGLGRARRAVAGSGRQEWLVWLLGATLFAQLLAYFGIDYFDQSRLVWYLLLVIFGTTAAEIQRSKTTREVVPEELAVVPERDYTSLDHAHLAAAGLSDPTKPAQYETKSELSNANNGYKRRL